MEMWTRAKLDLSNLRSFGCSAFAHHRDNKLGVRALRCIFLGYPEGVKGYKVWCLEEGKERLIVSRNVVFNELEVPMIKRVSAEHSRPEEDLKTLSSVKQEEEFDRSKHIHI